MQRSTRAYGPTGAMVVLIVANFMDLMDTTVVNVALPSISADLRASAAAVEWTVAAYTLGLAATLILGGRLGDLLGIRSVFLIGVGGFTLASLMATTAGDPGVLVAARALQGAFAGLMVPQVLAGVQVLYPVERRAPIFALVGFITGTASVVGPVLSGLLVSGDAFGIGWRSIFVINVPIGVLLIIAAARLVPGDRRTSRVRLDLPGVLLSSGGVLAAVLALIEGREHGWPWWTWLSLAIGAALLVSFAGWQRRTERAGGVPLIPLRLYTDRNYLCGSVVNFCFQAGLVGFFLVMTVFLQQGWGFSAMRCGLVWLGLSVGALLGSAVAPRVASSLGPIVMAVGALLFAASMIMVGGLVGREQQPHWWAISALLIIGGFGMGLIIVPLYDLSLRTVPTADAGSASGALSMVQQVGGSLGVAVIGGIFYARFIAVGTVSAVVRDRADAIQSAVAAAVVAIALTALAAIGAAWVVRRSTRVASAVTAGDGRAESSRS